MIFFSCSGWWGGGGVNWKRLRYGKLRVRDLRSRWAHWLLRTGSAEVEGRERLSGALYVQLCARPGSGAALKRSEKQQRHQQSRDSDIHSRLLLQPPQQPVRAADPQRTPYSLFRQQQQQQRGVGKFGEMQSAYQHLISLLFVFSSLHVDQLTEGCSCALSHPQDAFCNSEIGEQRLTAVYRPVFILTRAQRADVELGGRAALPSVHRESVFIGKEAAIEIRGHSLTQYWTVSGPWGQISRGRVVKLAAAPSQGFSKFSMRFSLQMTCIWVQFKPEEQ